MTQDTDQNNNPGGNGGVDVAELESKIRSQLQSEFEDEKAKILSNRDEILKEKKELQERFKGFDEDSFKKYQEFQAKVENDEMLRLASEGNFEELTQRMTASQQRAWDEKSGEYEERIGVLTENNSTLEAELAKLQGKNLDMQKNQFLKDLTATDDSFKHDHFGHFAQLYKDKMDLDEATGTVYALDENGKRLVDANGELESFSNFYNRMKTKDGLFWEAASGSGHLGQGGSDGLGSKLIANMTSAEKAELRKEIGDKKFTERMVAEINKK